MTVTQVVPLDKRRCKILLDEDLAFVLYKGEIKRYRIEEGGWLSEETYREIESQILLKRAKERAVYLLKASDKTREQLRRRLEEGFYPKQVIDQVLEVMERFHYVDDENFAVRYAENHSGSKSRRQIAFDLQRKGVGREEIEQALCQEIDEEGQIRKFLTKKRYSEQEFSKEEKHKLMAALGRRGFSYEIITKVMRDF